MTEMASLSDSLKNDAFVKLATSREPASVADRTRTPHRKNESRAANRQRRGGAITVLC
jgi:hypothetical protein